MLPRSSAAAYKPSDRPGYARAAGLDEFIHLGDWDEVLPLDALQPSESATDFPGDLSWVVQWSNMATDAATVAGAPLLAFLQAN